jgi:hypothetical protein
VLLAAVKDKELNLEDVIIQSRCFTVSMFWWMSQYLLFIMNL